MQTMKMDVELWYMCVCVCKMETEENMGQSTEGRPQDTELYGDGEGLRCLEPYCTQVDLSFTAEVSMQLSLLMRIDQQGPCADAT